MDGIGCIDVSLLRSPCPPLAAQTSGIVLFEPGVDGISEDESVVEVNSSDSSCGGKGKERQPSGTAYNHDHTVTADYASEQPVSMATAHWVNHNVPLLHEYAARQVSPPLSHQVDIEFNYPSQFVTGMMQMLANRDREGEEDPEPTRRTPPQLLEGYVNIERWATEYLRTQFGLEQLGDGVPSLLTIIANNFYEAQMHLTDAIVKQALKNMGIRRGSYLEAEDFDFRFEFKMTQEMPFLINSCHRVHETLLHLQGASNTQPGDITRSGRRSKPTAEPPGVQKKQVMPKIPPSERIPKKIAARASLPETDIVDTPVAETAIEKGRSRKPKADAKTPPESGGPSVAVSNKARQPLVKSSLANTAPPGGVGGGKTLAHLALIKQNAPVLPASTSRQAARSVDQRPPKIIITPLVHSASKLSTPEGLASGNTLTVVTTSKDTANAVDLPCDTAEVLLYSGTMAPRDPSTVKFVPQPVNPLPGSALPSLETSQYTKAVSLKRKRRNSAEGFSEPRGA